MYIWVGGLGGFSRVCVNTHASYGGCVSCGVMSADCKSVSGATGKLRQRSIEISITTIQLKHNVLASVTP